MRRVEDMAPYIGRRPSPLPSFVYCVLCMQNDQDCANHQDISASGVELSGAEPKGAEQS